MNDWESKLIQDFTALGIRKGGVLLVHSSLKSLGPFPGKADLIINSILEVLGEEGTLLMPALSFETVHKNNPNFDVANTPSCVGALTELFRKRDGVIRSVHPTHSVCGTGRLAEEILKDHYLDQTPCGSYSPFFKLNKANSQILFLGCGLRPNTSMHAVEEMVEPPYLFGEWVNFNITLLNQQKIQMNIKIHDFVGWKQRYDRIKNILSTDALKKGKILEAESYLVEAPAMWKNALKTLSKDPFYFVERIF